jgi:WD40 repeat protein
MARLSPLRYQTRVARFDPTGKYFVLGGVDGRAAVVSVSPPTHQPDPNDFKFAVARSKTETHFVNDVSFHPTAGAFCLAGGDGVVSAFTRSKMQLFRLPPAGGTSASCVSFAPDGSAIVVGYSYDYGRGGQAYTDQASIFMRPVAPNEMAQKR